MTSAVRCLAAALVLAALPHSLHAEGRWQRSTDGCLIWNEAPRAGETISWSGPCVADKAEGAGTAVWSYSERGRQVQVRYQGEMRAGRLEGAGILERSNGARVFGRWQEGRLEGEASYVSADGGRYEGEWQDGRYHGEGTYHAANGSRYRGEWRNGLKHGKGTYYAANGDRYEGQWKAGKKHGIGVYYFANGNRYKGPFVDDQLHGFGQCYTKLSAQWRECEMRRGKFQRWVR